MLNLALYKLRWKYFSQNFETLLRSLENKFKKPGHLINSLKPRPNGSLKNLKIAQH
jgi:hypothetical protein